MMNQRQNCIRLALLDVIKQLEADGIRCYWDESAQWKTYVVAGDTTGVAYFEYDLMQGWTLCTCHKPCDYTGTGYVLSTEKPTVTTVRQAMQLVRPAWERNSETTIVKYKSVDEYLKTLPVTTLARCSE